MTSREKFEQAIKARFGDLIDYRVCKNSDGEYMAWDMQVAWWAWQAAETDMAVQLTNAESKCRDLSSKAMELVCEASLVYSKYNDTQMPDRDLVDMQTLQEMHDLCKGAAL
ncbi:hypothetical protein ABV255_001415 [Citrobacter braakii]